MRDRALGPRRRDRKHTDGRRRIRGAGVASGRARRKSYPRTGPAEPARNDPIDRITIRFTLAQATTEPRSILGGAPVATLGWGDSDEDTTNGDPGDAV